MRPLRILLGAIVAACGLVLVSPAPAAQACFCASAGLAADVEWADTVFEGTLVRVDGARTPQFNIYVFDVHRVYEGRVGARTEVMSPSSGASCGLGRMDSGATYLMFAATTRLEEAPMTSSCTGNQRASPALRERVEALLGPGDPPVGARPPRAMDGVEGGMASRSWTVFYVLAGLSAALLTAVAWALSPRRTGKS